MAPAMETNSSISISTSTSAPPPLFLLCTTTILIALVSLFLLAHARNRKNHTKAAGRLPPGPPALRRSIFDLAPLLLDMHARYGPVISLRLARTLVFVADRRLAHKLLVQGGATFADRPPPVDPNRLFSAGGRDISSSSYGTYWRLVRRNLASERHSSLPASPCSRPPGGGRATASSTAYGGKATLVPVARSRCGRSSAAPCSSCSCTCASARGWARTRWTRSRCCSTACFSRSQPSPSSPYLKAVVVEGLRLHPPGHFVLPHCVRTDHADVGGYTVPRGAEVNFLVAEIGRDETVLTAPQEFRPDRFLDDGEGCCVDITGSREIKMMPFGAGRRMCPGYSLGIHHAEYFVARMVQDKEWRPPVDGVAVDMAEQLDFTTVMKQPLRARIVAMH